MGTVTTEPTARTVVRPGQRLTLSQYEALPDDAVDPAWWKVELLDGVLVVTSAPRDLHGAAHVRLGALLEAARVPGTTVLAGNGVVGGATGTVPDLSVKRTEDLEDRRAVPLLVVEVLSPATRPRDLGAKRRLYAALGVPTYWLVDVDVPSVLVLRRGGDGEYVEVEEVVGQDRLTVDDPYPLDICPADLVRP